MTYSTLTIERDGALAIVRMNRPEARNALNVELIAELGAVARDLREARDIGAVILTGSPNFFCSGADCKDRRIFAPQDRSLLDHWKDTEAGSETARAWEALPGVTIAAIEGFAVGGGLTLAMACDFRVMGASAFLHIPEVELGFTYGWNSIPRLLALAGPARTRRLVLLGDRIDAATALDWGIADEVAAAGSALIAARAIAATALRQPRMAVQLAKRSINATVNHAMDVSSHADMAQILLCLQEMKRAGAQGA